MIFIPTPELRRPRNIAFIVGVLFSAAAIAGAFIDWEHFLQAYLVGWLFLLSLSIGCLGVLMINYVGGGIWGFPVRRILEASALMSFLLAVLVIPLLFGMQSLWIWTRPDALTLMPELAAKTWWLNVPFFIGRVIGVFIIFCGAAWLLRRWSLRQDATPSKANVNAMIHLSAPGMPVLVLAVSAVAVDFVMSLQPRWYSTMWGFEAVASYLLGAMSFAIVMLVLLGRRLPQLRAAAPPGRLQDLGNLMFTFVIFWMYIAFSQFLLIYCGNLPDEVTYYIDRITGGWQYMGLSILAFNFALPFAVLLFRSVKRRTDAVGIVAGVLVASRFVHVYWMVIPEFRPLLYVHWLDFVVPLAQIGLWLGFFLWQYGAHPSLPRRIQPIGPDPTSEISPETYVAAPAFGQSGPEGGGA